MNKLTKFLKKGVKIHVKHGRHDLGYEIKEVFIGHRTLFSVLGFIVGGLIVGRSIWEYLNTAFGLNITIVIGILIFILSGIVLHEFREPSPKKDDNLML